MRGGRLGLALPWALLAPLACSTQSSNNNYLPPTGGGGSVVMPQPNEKVMVTVVTPTDGTAVSDSSDLAVTATADVVMGSDLIDTSSVKMALTAMGSNTVIGSGQLVSGGGDTYSGMLSIGNLPSGNYQLTVTAQTTTGVSGTQTVMLVIQGGPTLIVSSPAEGQPYSNLLTVEVMVDPGAPAPTAMLAGMQIMWSAGSPMSSGTYDVYQAQVWFGPPPTPAGAQPFPTLTGTQLIDVKETANGSTSEVQRDFVIDTSGPSITMTTPAPGAIVGGPVEISAQITDESGVLASSVSAVVGDAQGNPVFTLQLQPLGGNLYGVQFDTLSLTQCPQPPASGPCIVFPTISFRATDSVGNESSLGYDFSVDNIAPLSDLDPPELRQMKLASTGYVCSFMFDPLSVNQDIGDMPNDGCVVPQVFDLRARIEDQGNAPNGLKIVPLSGIDPDNTAVYILTDNTQPLIVDSDGNGTCDTINPLLSPTMGPLTQSDQVLKIRLSAVTPGGAADFRPDGSVKPPLPCGPGTDIAPPKVLCTVAGSEQPTVAMSYAGGLPDIWGVEPVDPASCFGNQLDTRANNIPDGQWICIAVQSADLLGNKGVSTALRVYVQYDETGPFCATPPANAPPPPTCTGTYDPVSKTATQGACTTLSFPSGELYCAPGGC